MEEGEGIKEMRNRVYLRAAADDKMVVTQNTFTVSLSTKFTFLVVELGAKGFQQNFYRVGCAPMTLALEAT